MAETKTLEREYIVPLRSAWLKKVKYKRTRASVMAVKAFIAKHMKVEDRDTSKVKLDTYLNNELWFRGCKKPPAKIKVHAKKEGDIVTVTLVDVPDIVKFAQKRHEKRHKPVAKKKAAAKADDKKEDKAEEQTEDEKKAEGEKEQSVAEANQKIAQQTAKAAKHTQTQSAPQVQRKALKK